MNYAEESLRLHGEWKGKIEVLSLIHILHPEPQGIRLPQPAPGDPHSGVPVQPYVTRAGRGADPHHRHGLLGVSGASAALQIRSGNHPGPAAPAPALRRGQRAAGRRDAGHLPRNQRRALRGKKCLRAGGFSGIIETEYVYWRPLWKINSKTWKLKSATPHSIPILSLIHI